MRRYRFTDEQQAMLENMPQPLAVYQFIDNRVVTLALSDGFCALFGYKEREKAYLESMLFEDIEAGAGAPFITHVRKCSKTGKPAFYDELLPDGTLIHSFARRIAWNPVSGRSAVAVSVLSITDASYATNMA